MNISIIYLKMSQYVNAKRTFSILEIYTFRKNLRRFTLGDPLLKDFYL